MAAHSHESLLMSLAPSPSDGTIGIATDSNDIIQLTADLIGSGDIGSVEVHPLHGSVLGLQHCFQVSMPGGSKFFSCRSDTQRQEWMEQ